MTDEQILGIAKGVYEEVVSIKGLTSAWEDDPWLRDVWVAEVRAWAGLDDQEKANSATKRYIVAKTLGALIR